MRLFSAEWADSQDQEFLGKFQFGERDAGKTRDPRRVLEDGGNDGTSHNTTL
jgi:hypothetical protein